MDAPMTGCPPPSPSLSRRTFLSAAIGAGALASRPAASQQSQVPPEVTRDWSGQMPVRYPDPDVIALDDRFRRYMIGNTTIRRLHTGTLWAEGPAWNGVGRFLMWSDIPNNVQLRYIEDDGRVSVFRNPSGYSNGNTFDREGRQISCEHGNRRVTRYEPNGSVTVLADKFQNKPLNGPNDAVVAPDGAVWFTDPGYGTLMHYEGNKGQLELKQAVYRLDKSGKLDKATDEIYMPNGLCFSPDYKRLYVADTGATHFPEAPKNIKVWEVADGRTLRGGKQFVSMELPGKGAGLADGIRADVDGNVWVGAGWVGAGYDGVHVFAPTGERIGQILLPERCANIAFGGQKRNRLFMAASQSLFSLYVNTRGSHFC